MRTYVLLLISVTFQNGYDDVVDEVAQREHSTERAECRFDAELQTPIDHVDAPRVRFNRSEHQ